MLSIIILLILEYILISDVIFINIVLHREFINDPIHSAYWFIRALSCISNDLSKVKDNIEMDFHVIRREFVKKEYEVIPGPTMIKNDMEYMPLLYYRIMGILYMNIDIDNIEGYSKNFFNIIEKILNLYNNIPDNFKFHYEINGGIEQMIMLFIFNFHYNLNSKINFI